MAKLPWKPWHEVVKLRDDLKSGELPLHMFAADLYEVLMQNGKRPIYEKPENFFALTFPTHNLRALVRDVVLRLAGKNDKAVRQLELTYGGGKTHTLITLRHLAHDPAALPDLPAVAEFEQAIGMKPPKARVAGLCFDKLDVETGMDVRSPDGSVRRLKQPWSVLAYQIAGDDGLKLLHADKKAEERESAPAENVLTELLELPVKQEMGVLILIDEVLMYVREKVALTPEYRARMVNFFQYLTQAATKVDRCCIVASLLASDPKKNDAFGNQLKSELYDIFQRQREEAVEPVVKEDVAEVLRRRFFTTESIKTPGDFKQHVIAAIKGIADLDEQTAKQGVATEERYLKSFPFHPELTEVFYSKWTQLDGFQRTRGVLRTFALALREAEKWDTSPLVGPAAFLGLPGKAGLSEAVGELVTVADTGGGDGGRRQAWTGILVGELTQAQNIQVESVGLKFREIEEAVIATFLHSQPIGQSAKTRELMLLLGPTRPFKIDLEKGLMRWAQTSHWLDDRLAPGGNDLPAQWRLGNRPNLNQMHSKAASDISDDVARARLIDEIGKTKALTAGASAAGVRVHTLPLRMQRLLVHPSTLDAWHRLASRGSTRRDFATQTQLLAALIDALRQEAVRDHQVHDVDVHAVLEMARTFMERCGRLSAPATIFDSHTAALRACCAVGLLVRNDGAVGFPHQSYFDHLVARAALRASGHSPNEIVQWIKRDQSLLRRDQLRQLLFALRDEDLTTAALVTEAVLVDAGVRFHLKQLVCGVLREADPVTTEDVALVVKLAALDEWREHVRTRILWRSPAWFDALHSRGVWARWLAESAGDRRLSWLHTIAMLMEQRPQDVDRLIEPVLAEPNGKDLVGRVLSHDPSEDSPLVAELRDAQVRAGRWAIHDVLLDKMVDRDPGRAVRLVECVIRGALRRGLAAASSDAERHVEGLRDGAFEKGVAKAVRLHAQQSFLAFSRLLRVCERLKAAFQPKATTLEDLDTRYFRFSSLFTSITDILTTLTADAVAGLSDSIDGRLQSVLDSKHVQKSLLLSTAVAIGLVRASEHVSDAALIWLCAEPERLLLRESFQRDEHGLAADVIRRHAPKCSEETLGRLMSLLLKYHPSHEKDGYRHLLEGYLSKGAWGFTNAGRYHAHINPVGRAQHLLLGAIPVARRSPEVRERLCVWDAKFGGPAVERAGYESRGGSVGSPIPQDRIGRLRDRQWLDIVSRRWTSRRWKQIGPDRVAESSPEHFANDLGQAAKLSPRRFVQLSLRFPAEAPPVYISRLWDALADRATDVASCDPAELDAMLDRTITTGDRNAITSACRAIENHPRERWGESAWRLLEIAADHEEPKTDEYTVHSIESATKRPDIESTSLNCVRGSAASALAALAWNDSERAGRVLPLASRLATDPHPAVRLAAAHTAFGIYTINKDEGAALATTIAAHDDDRVLSGHWLSQCVQYVRWSHPGVLHPVFDRMMRSAISKVTEIGARWVTAEHFQCGVCTDKYAECRHGTVYQRVGVAKTLGHLLSDERVDAARVEAELAQLFDDLAPEVRAAAAGAFRVEGTLQSDAGARLAAVFVRSAAFVEESETLVWPLSHESVDLVRYASVVFAAADRFATELAEQTRSMQNRLGMAGRELSSLLLRLYDAATKLGDRGLADACLDRWDSLLANRVGDAEAHLESLIG